MGSCKMKGGYSGRSYNRVTREMENEPGKRNRSRNLPGNQGPSSSKAARAREKFLISHCGMCEQETKKGVRLHAVEKIAFLVCTKCIRKNKLVKKVTILA